MWSISSSSIIIIVISGVILLLAVEMPLNPMYASGVMAHTKEKASLMVSVTTSTIGCKTFKSIELLMHHWSRVHTLPCPVIFCPLELLPELENFIKMHPGMSNESDEINLLKHLMMFRITGVVDLPSSLVTGLLRISSRSQHPSDRSLRCSIAQ